YPTLFRSCPLQVRSCFPRARPVSTVHHLRPAIHPSSACVSQCAGVFRGSSDRPPTAPPHRTSMSFSRHIVIAFPERSLTASQSFHGPCAQEPWVRPRKPTKDISQKAQQQARTYSANTHEGTNQQESIIREHAPPHLGALR